MKEKQVGLMEFMLLVEGIMNDSEGNNPPLKVNEGILSSIDGMLSDIEVIIYKMKGYFFK